MHHINFYIKSKISALFIDFCVFSHMVISENKKWTFHLSGMISDLSPICHLDPCLYTRDNDTAVYCFSSNSCINKLSQLHRIQPLLDQVLPKKIYIERTTSQWLSRCKVARHCAAVYHNVYLNETIGKMKIPSFLC